MPQPHEQKLHEVVNSLTFASLKVFAAAFTAGTSRRPPSASPVPPPSVVFSQSRRLRVGSGGRCRFSMAFPLRGSTPEGKPCAAAFRAHIRVRWIAASRPAEAADDIPGAGRQDLRRDFTKRSMDWAGAVLGRWVW